MTRTEWPEIGANPDHDSHAEPRRLPKTPIRPSHTPNASRCAGGSELGVLGRQAGEHGLRRSVCLGQGGTEVGGLVQETLATGRGEARGAGGGGEELHAARVGEGH